MVQGNYSRRALGDRGGVSDLCLGFTSGSSSAASQTVTSQIRRPAVTAL